MSFPFTLQDMARALGGEVAGAQVRCPGPGHTIKDRSLAVTPMSDAPGGFLVYSFAGDDPLACKDYVRQKLGLAPWEPRGKRQPEAEYTYLTAEGAPYLLVRRYRKDGRKVFYQSHWTPAGWENGKPSGDPIPYRLPEMVAAVHNTVFICEGEKDADRLTGLGFVATTAPGGAGKWDPCLNHWFKDKVAHILADNDEPGRRHAYDIARNLHGIAETVRVVELPGLPPKGDVSDWLDEDPGRSAILVDYCLSVDPWAPGGSNTEDFGVSFSSLRLKQYMPVCFIVDQVIPQGCTILAGRPKLGKSWLGFDVGIRVAASYQGYVLGDKVCASGDVLCLALEDNERRLQSRGKMIIGGFGGEWPQRLTIATQWPRADEGGLEKIERWAQSVEKPTLVIIDVLAAFRSSVRSNDKQGTYANDYDAVAKLRDLGNRLGFSVLIVHHVRKGGADDPIEAVSGTLGLAGAADTTLVLNRTGNDVTLYGRGRDVAEFEYAMTFEPATGRWSIKGDAADVRRSNERSRILQVLLEADEPMGPVLIANLTGMARNSVDQLLHEMVAAGEVRKVGRGSYVHPSREDLIRTTESKSDKKDKKVSPEGPETWGRGAAA